MSKKRAYNFIDKTGQVFGKLTVLEFFGSDIWHNAVWKCQCDCGNTINVVSGNLKTGHTKSCGCISKPHGMYYTRLYRIFRGIKDRCLNPNSPDYPTYKNKLCERWFYFINFQNDLGPSYNKHVEEFGEKNTSIDRFPNQSGNYEPGNVRWATLAEQNRNRCISAITDNYEKHMHWRRRLSNYLNSVIQRDTDSSLFKERFGCTLSEFKSYIESLWLPGMSWNNHGMKHKWWQFDHIIGCNNFDLSKEEDRYNCWHYTNLKPIWYADHMKKSRLRVNL